MTGHIANGTKRTTRSKTTGMRHIAVRTKRTTRSKITGMHHTTDVRYIRCPLTNHNLPFTIITYPYMRRKQGPFATWLAGPSTDRENAMLTWDDMRYCLRKPFCSGDKLAPYPDAGVKYGPGIPQGTTFQLFDNGDGHGVQSAECMAGLKGGSYRLVACVPLFETLEVERVDEVLNILFTKDGVIVDLTSEKDKLVVGEYFNGEEVKTFYYRVQFPGICGNYQAFEREMSARWKRQEEKMWNRGRPGGSAWGVMRYMSNVGCQFA